MRRLFYQSIVDGRVYLIKPLSDVSILVTNDCGEQGHIAWSYFIDTLYGGLDKTPTYRY